MTAHKLADAETKFANAHPDRGYTCDLSELIQENDQFKEAQSLATKGQRSGYSFLMKGCDKDTTGKVNNTYEIVACPWAEAEIYARTSLGGCGSPMRNATKSNLDA